MAPSVKESLGDTHERSTHQAEWGAVFGLMKLICPEGRAESMDWDLKYKEWMKRGFDKNREISWRQCPIKRKRYRALLQLGRRLAEKDAARSRQEALRASKEDENLPVSPSVAPASEAHTTTTPSAMDSNFVSDNVNSLGSL